MQAGKSQVVLRLDAGRARDPHVGGASRRVASSAVLPIPASPRTTSAPLSAHGRADQAIDYRALARSTDKFRAERTS